MGRGVEVGEEILDKGEGLREARGILDREGEGCGGLLEEAQGSEGVQGDVETGTAKKYCHLLMEAVVYMVERLGKNQVILVALVVTMTMVPMVIFVVTMVMIATGPNQNGMRVRKNRSMTSPLSRGKGACNQAGEEGEVGEV